jgi:two-component system heavy metal sensor histidine kinase CusS
MSSSTGPELPQRRLSLAWRMTLWQAAAAFVTVLGTTALLYWAQVARFEQISEEFIREHVQIVRTLLADRPKDLTGLRHQVDLEALEGIYIRVLDPEWRLVLETPQMEELLPTSLLSGPERRGVEHERPVTLQGGTGKTFRAMACAAPADVMAPLSHWLVVAYDRSEEAAVLAEFRARAIPALLLALVLCVAFGHQIARRALRPVHEISEKMLQIHSSTLGDRVDLARLPAELHELAGTFNGMLDRLQGAFHRLARFSADIAHELRTPVNNLRGVRSGASP